MIARFLSRYGLLLLGAACAAPGGPGPVPQTRTYYIAADEVNWDYIPTSLNQIRGDSLQGVEVLIGTSGSDRIGRVYRKALYREYTDSTFTTLKPRPAEWEHLGYLGPLIRAVVGDTIRVVFHNNAMQPYSVHPHGVFYDKASEGAGYNDGSPTSDRGDDGVQPDSTYTYTWTVPMRAGPTKEQGSTAMWMYHSHVNESKDVNAGLMGVMLITDPLMAKADGTPNDIDREFVVAFAEIDENDSWYFEHNINTFATDPASVDRDANFAELSFNLNLRETMNGYQYGHIPGLTMKVGERVRWYTMGTTNFEVHAPHWHGQTLISNMMRTDVLSLVTMEMATADMVPDNPGTWLFHCHVGFHFQFGMGGMFTVTE
jgi:hephaestin